MNYEGLQDTSNKVQVWTTYLAKILRDKYHIVGDNCPFSFKRKEHDNTILIKSQELELLSEYKVFLINSIKKELASVADLDIAAYNWRIVGNSIVRACKDAAKMNTLHEILMLLMGLERYFDSRVIEGNKSIHDLVDSYYKDIQDKALRYLVEWKEDAAFYKKLLEIYQPDEFDEVIVEEDDDEEFNAGNTENKLLLDLRKLIRLLALSEIEKVVIDGRKAKLLELVGDKISTEEISAFSSIALLNKHIVPVIQNYELFLFPMIAKTYKTFRLQEFEKGNGERWNLTLLKRIAKTQDNRPLHPQEQSLILGIINNIILEIRKASISKFDTLSHRFGKAYKEVCCPVIGIDEATDYCLLDFYAINSLKHYDVSAITMTGDGMQCLKENGVFEWSSLNDKRLF
ncbi:MAG: hypothetical protein Q4D12_11370, partial [Bacteroidales bacterium]|nr:hypothetical protein [Bacteroidales bacterium]